MRRLAIFLMLGAVWTPCAAAQRSGHAVLPPPLPSTKSLQMFDQGSSWLVQLRPDASFEADVLVRQSGATLVSERLRIWKITGASQQRLIRHLLRSHAIRAIEPDHRLLVSARPTPADDPLTPTQWWVSVIGADQATPPGAGVPVTDVDSGLDLTHPEFAGRPSTTALNAQTTTANPDEAHGTAVSSVIGAPSNGVGVVGVYPQVALQAWDASPAGYLDDGEIIRGILAAADRHIGVINLSLAGTQPDFLLEEAVLAAFGEGSLVVAAAGNEFANGNPLTFPASYEHVLTVAATGESNAPAYFSSSSLAVDLSAPGQDIPVAVPLWANASGFDVKDGTSFAAPLVSGAASWVWTVRPQLENTQLFDLLRWTARDLGPADWDPDTGFGLLNIPSALAGRAPARDPQEPNEDIFLVRPNGLFRQGTPFIVGRGRSSVGFGDRLDFTEDPEDVFRAWVPAHRSITVNVRGGRKVHLALWGPRTRTVFERGAALRRDLIASKGPGRTLRISAVNGARRGVLAYVDVWVGKNTLNSAFSLGARLH
jgi:Subtilase family